MTTERGPPRGCSRRLDDSRERRRSLYVVMNSERVRSLREQRGMSQRRLSEASGVSRRTLTSVEAGKVHTLPSTARKIGVALEVDPRSLARVASRA
jgi:DNA-binding XRE family transcriptional regulator